MFLVFGIDDKARGIFLGSVKWFHHDTSFGHAPLFVYGRLTSMADFCYVVVSNIF